MCKKTQLRGFTLVEILIVVIILGILASIIMPQFAPATDQTRMATLSGQLQTIRAQIQLFIMQHEEKSPTLNGSNWDDLVKATTVGTDVRGPYLAAIPQNALNTFDGVAVIDHDPQFGEAVAGNKIGFVYNPTNGFIWATNKSGTRVFDESNWGNPNNN